jgi:CheY-like chemotaxis protein
MDLQRILVVDDDPQISGLIFRHLSRTQRFVARTENRPARAVAAAREFQPDLILLDVDMPGLDGGGVAADLEADPSLCRVPIVFVTSLVSPSEAGQGMVVLNGRRFLSKPVNADALIAAVDCVLAADAPP